MSYQMHASEAEIRKHRASGAWRRESVVDDVARWASETPEAPALRAHRAGVGLTTVTYRELHGWVERFASALAELGVGPGDVVSMQLPNWWQAPALALATWRRGAVLASIMTTIRSRELERMLAAVGASVFVTVDRWDGYEHAAVVAEMAPRLPALRHRVVLGADVADGEIDFVRFFQETDHPEPPEHATDPDAVASVLFTSGTTGEPKAALRTLNSFYAFVRPFLLEIEGSPARMHTPQSMMHAVGHTVTTYALVSGSSVLLTDRWEPARTARLLAEERIDQLAIMSSFLSELLDTLRSENIRLPLLRNVWAIGTTPSRQVVDETADVLGLPLRNLWGMTEGGQIVTAPDDPPGWAAHSIGRAGSGLEIELRPSGTDAPITEHNPGRLLIRGASVCLATLGRDSGTVRVLAEHDDGWYDTGDLAVPDGRRGYRIVGRASDRIGGAFMIPVADVEDALRAHPDIDDVAIVGHRDNTEGCAVVVSSVPVSLEGVRSYLDELGMTEWYWPTRVARVDTLPRNAMGKVEKARLRTWLAAVDLPATG